MNMNQPAEENYTPQPPQPQPTPPSRMVPVKLPASTPSVTYTIIGITVVVYLLQLLSQFALGGDLLVQWGAKANDYIRAGQLWRFFSPMLLHGSILHIA